MAGFRSGEMEEQYELFKKENNHDSSTFTFDWEGEALETFEHWALLPCPFYYDLIAEEHHLLVPKRTFGGFADMNVEEFEELKEIKTALGHRYSFVLENFPSQITVPTHFHMHFIKAKDTDGSDN